MTTPRSAPLRGLVDTMIFDAIADEPGMLGRVDRLTAAGRLVLLAATVSVEQVAATLAAPRRRLLRRVRVLVVPPADADADPETLAVIAALGASPGVDRGDALIAAAAARQGVPLVTEDRDLRAAVAAHLPQVPCWTWAADLRPRLVAADPGPTA